MKIAIANDHRGYNLKKQLISYLKEMGYDVLDLGTDSLEAVDYPIYAKKVADNIIEKNADMGILICGTGIGMSIAANKIKGIRCAKVSTEEEAYLTRLHNDANVLALSYKLVEEEAFNIVKKFLNTEKSNEKRNRKRNSNKFCRRCHFCINGLKQWFKKSRSSISQRCREN